MASMTRYIPLLVISLLSACATQSTTQSAMQPANVNLSGFPPAFREGYADGCASAHGPTMRSESRFKSDQQYASGWRDVRDICKRR